MYQKRINALHISMPSVCECHVYGREGLECSRHFQRGDKNTWHPNSCKGCWIIQTSNFWHVCVDRDAECPWSRILKYEVRMWNRTTTNTHALCNLSHCRRECKGADTDGRRTIKYGQNCITKYVWKMKLENLKPNYHARAPRVHAENSR